jgi:hypothetical protein
MVADVDEEIVAAVIRLTRDVTARVQKTGPIHRP